MCNKTAKQMKTVANTRENNAKVKALKSIAETKWAGATTFSNIDACLTGLNLQTTNSGWYKPTAIKINGVSGYFMINQDGSIFCEARIIKESENKFVIEYMTNTAWNEFERLYSEFINE